MVPEASAAPSVWQPEHWLLANTGAPGSSGSWGPSIPGAPATLAM